LEENFEENSPKLQAYREEALKREIKGLNPDQKKVYEMAIEKHIQVIAGPGSGKTFTLILRIARLIQEERVNPETILVLAYNRAVVVELKERLSKLFKELGYSKLISRLKVFTFHGFAKYCLGNQINDLKFDDWTPEFIRIMTNSPGLINQKLGTIKYVFVDEFQDITSERLKLINFIANPQETKICVIGDPNQSIYGYQRDQQNEPMEPKPYYDDFKNIYNPEELNLSINYRSYPLILKEAETILALNESKFPMPKLVPHLIPKTDEVYCEIVDLVQSPIDWKVKVKDFLDYRDIDDEKYRQIAVMFRSNDEVYRAYNLLKNEKIPNVKIRIQGAKGSLLKTREFYHSLTLYKQCLDDKLQDNYVAVYENNKKKILSKYKNWEEYFLDIFHCLLIEFENDREEESTYENLCEFIAEISAKDDGQLAKIYDKNIGRIKQDAIKQEIIITTMHKVKGVEYDAVIIPASLSNLPQKPVSVDKIKSYIEEERRVYYVAYTRAKKRLLAIKYDRENAIDNGTNFTFNTQLIKKKYGFKVEEGIDKFTMFWSASPNGGISFNHIRDKVKIGDAIEIKEFMEGFFVLHNEIRIAKISNTMSKKMKDMQQMKGFVVSSVYVNTYDETLMSDENSKKDFDVKKHTNYALNWTTEAKERGYIYLIDFSGYGN
jgi:ATP-dependent DNA helicase RecQ